LEKKFRVRGRLLAVKLPRAVAGYGIGSLATAWSVQRIALML
jgi:hypothetical protein